MKIDYFIQNNAENRLNSKFNFPILFNKLQRAYGSIGKDIWHVYIRSYHLRGYTSFLGLKSRVFFGITKKKNMWSNGSKFSDYL